jgi:hypothetical protein
VQAYEQNKMNVHKFLGNKYQNVSTIFVSGMRFGLMQTKVGLVSLLSKYQFSVSQKTPVPLVLDKKSFILAPAGGMWLKIKNRRIK